MRINSRKIIRLIEEMAPLSLAEGWDATGVQLGSMDAAIDKVMVALEITEEVVREAEEKSVDLIVTHHPFLFKPVHPLTDQTPEGAMIRRLIKGDIHVYSAHTNLDSAKGGLNDFLAEKLGLSRLSPLRPVGRESLYKLVVFVPETHLEALQQALTTAGAGKIGLYEGCSFASQGTGRFLPLEGANPNQGAVGQYESVQEIRLELVVTEDKISAVIETIQRVHPYETPAYDFFPRLFTEKYDGMGRIGYLDKPMKAEAMAQHFKTVLGNAPVRLAGPSDKTLRKVAVCTGAGADLLKDAQRQGCDALITGDVKYHDARTAESMGMALLDGGHFETENIYMAEWAAWLQRKVEEKEYTVSVILSSSLQSPFKQY